MPTRREMANAIRALAMDAVQQAHSGHPGMPMGMADIATVLWCDFLRHNPNNTMWFNRDRFVLSNGHGAMLQYALLHLSGYALSMDDIKNFRQLHSKTPGHPEFADTPGVETTTGPLGQGLANAVGMALAEKHLAAIFNREGFPIVDHHTYAFVGDGCLMEGVSHEACSLAGTLKLNKLIVIYDDNGISIDGEVSHWFTDNTPQRFRSYHWHVIENVDGHDMEAVQAALTDARSQTERPTLICCKTQIGYGSPNKANTAASHGSPLGDDEIRAARQQLGWHHEPFSIPAEIYAAWDARQTGQDAENEWNNLFAKYEAQFPQLAAEYLRRQCRFLPEDWAEFSEQFIQSTVTNSKDMATRKASQLCLNSFAAKLPELLGGSADLTGSNCTQWDEAQDFSADLATGRYVKYGVREFAMSAIMNGLALHGGIIPFGGTFLVFSDYARNAVRLCALMRQKVIFVYSHDSIGLGEDGPTHQPIEHASMLRLTPGMVVWRPCDLSETAVAWQQALQHQGPSSLLLSRQNLPANKRDKSALANIKRGGYILHEPRQTPEGIIIATGSEVPLAMQASQQLAAQGLPVRVVSMPSCEIFRAQEPSYRQEVLPPHIKARVAIEAGMPDYWFSFVGEEGVVIGIQTFGLSAPANDVYQALGITVENIVQQMTTLCETLVNTQA